MFTFMQLLVSPSPYSLQSTTKDFTKLLADLL
ncbi:hypothetical protein V6Z12_D08G171700 [Gossypium hirsutum]